MASQPSLESQTHPSYDSTDTDVEIVCNSGRGMHFRVHSSILSLASEIFKEKILDARRSRGSGVITIHLEEGDSVVKNLLDAFHPNVNISFPGDLTFSALLPIAEAAERYKVISVLHTIRRTAFNVSLTDFQPLERYKLACRLQWKMEALFSAKLSLSTDLMTNESVAYLQELPHDDVLALLWFHGSRNVLREPGYDYRKSGLEIPTPVSSFHWSNILSYAISQLPWPAEAPTTTRAFHPSYNSEDADLVLVSDWGSGSCFRVHAAVLKAASEVFSDMLQVQRGDTEDKETPIPLAEKDDVLKSVLD